MSAQTWMECDIEIPGWHSDHIESSAHIYDNATFVNRPFCYQVHGSPELFSDKYHTYSLEWTPTYVVWDMDGFVYRRSEITANGKIRDRSWSFHDGELERDDTYDLNWIAVWATYPMDCAFDIWMGDYPDWLGPWSEESCGIPVFFSFFKYYRYTPGTGHNGTDFTLEDWDDFDGTGTNFDQVRWFPYNVEMREGKAMGAVHCDGSSGYSGSVPPDDGDTGVSEPTVSARHLRRDGYSGGSLEYRNGMITCIPDKSGFISLAIYDLNGKQICVLVNDEKTSGRHSFKINQADFAPGTRLLSLKTSDGHIAQRITTGIYR
jgi:hypothetical protein